MGHSFSAIRTGVAITATTGGSAAVLLDTDKGTAAACPDAMVDNSGGAIQVRVVFGGSGVVADSKCAPVPAGNVVIYGKPGATHCSAWCSAGTQTINVILGDGV
jgi:hypothetical protein